MSIQAVAWVLDHSLSRHSARLALIAIANHENKDTRYTILSFETIAKEAGLSRRAAIDAVWHLSDKLGELEITERGDRKAHGYSIVKGGPASEGSALGASEGYDEALVQNPGEPSEGSAPVPKELTVKNVPKSYPAPFEQFWMAYPRKIGKLKAHEVWQAHIREHRATAEEITVGAERYRDDPNREPEFTAHATTWLRAGRWADEDPEPTRSGRRLSPLDEALKFATEGDGDGTTNGDRSRDEALGSLPRASSG